MYSASLGLLSLCYITSSPKTSLCLRLPPYLCSCPRSTLPFVHLAPWPVSDKEGQLTKSALRSRLSAALTNLLFSLQSTPFSTLFLSSFSHTSVSSEWFKSCSLTDQMCRSKTKWVCEGERKIVWDEARSWRWNRWRAEVEVKWFSMFVLVIQVC